MDFFALLSELCLPILSVFFQFPSVPSIRFLFSLLTCLILFCIQSHEFILLYLVSGNDTLGGDSSVHSAYVQYVDGSPDSALYAATNGQMYFHY